MPFEKGSGYPRLSIVQGMGLQSWQGVHSASHSSHEGFSSYEAALKK